MRAHLAEKLREVDAARVPGREPALGMVTHGISPTIFEAIFIPGWEAKEMLEDFDGFIRVFQRQCIIAAHRFLFDYGVDLLTELIEGSLISLPAEEETRIRTRWISPDGLRAACRRVGIPMGSEPDGDLGFRRLTAMRNVLEHNDGVANERFVDVADDTSIRVGDRIEVGARQVGRALSCAEITARIMNEQAMARWPELSAPRA